MDHSKIINVKKYIYFSGQFDDRGGATMQYGVHCPMEWRRSMATLEATGRCHRASIGTVLPRRPPWSMIPAKKIKLWHCEIAVPKLAFKRYKTDLYSAHLIEATSCVEMSNATI
jgi:hypothetical protein